MVSSAREVQEIWFHAKQAFTVNEKVLLWLRRSALGVVSASWVAQNHASVNLIKSALKGHHPLNKEV
jgi:hypothetical protein